MQNLLRTSWISLLLTLVGCNSDKDKTSVIYNAYKFDQKVIEKLPIYDSLAIEISEKYQLFQNSIDKNDGYQAFRYMPNSYETEVFKRLPQNVGNNIDRYFNALGQDFIYGFDLFKDSTIKIYIRTYPSEKTLINIEENLSYFPKGLQIRRREFPVKDTILNTHWQYWARFNKQGLF